MTNQSLFTREGNRAMIGIPIGLVYANATEWFVHRYILHGLGRNKTSFWAFHWHDHHKNVRKNGHIDESYLRSLFELAIDSPQNKEALALIAAATAHLPLLPVAPFFTGTVVYATINYYRKHKRSHVDPQWAREHLSWHYDHHMGPDQDANWCVTKPWFDVLMGTRKPYVGTGRERRDQERASRRRTRGYSSPVVSVNSDAA